MSEFSDKKKDRLLERERGQRERDRQDKGSL